MVPSMIRPLSEHMDVPTSTTDHVSQGVHHESLPEMTEVMNQIEETSTAASTQEELATSMEHSEEQ